MRSRYATWAVVFGFLACLAPTLYGDSKESYKAGQEALDEERWAAAERFFSEAIADRPEERFNALLGRRYFPHYYLGVARSEQGKCPQALQAFRETERQGKVQRVTELINDLKRRRQACEARRAAVREQADGVAELLDQSADGFETLEGLRQKPALASLWNQGNPSFAGRTEQLRGQEGQLRQQLSAARERESADDVQSVEGLAQKLLADIRQTIADARTELGDRNAATASALEDLEAIEGRARRQLRTVQDLAPFPRNLARRVGALQSLLKEVLDTKDTAQSGQLVAYGERLEDAMGQLSRAARRPPDVLRRAVESFFAGDYDAVLSGLETFEARREVAVAQVCLLRAASRFHLFTLSGEDAIELEAAALADLQACPAKDALQPPNAAYFSPRFRRFFEQAMAPEVAEDSDDVEALDGAPPGSDSPGGEAASDDAGDAAPDGDTASSETSR